MRLLFFSNNFCAMYLSPPRILTSVTLDALELEEENADEIEESAEPHVLWGLQGSPYVYCSLSGASGLDAAKEESSGAGVHSLPAPAVGH
jgi:hypothetical protein